MDLEDMLEYTEEAERSFQKMYEIEKLEKFYSDLNLEGFYEKCRCIIEDFWEDIITYDEALIRIKKLKEVK